MRTRPATLARAVRVWDCLSAAERELGARTARLDARLLQMLLNEGVIPVVPPIGFDGEGRTFRVNSDAVAVEIAEAMQAMKRMKERLDDISKGALNMSRIVDAHADLLQGVPYWRWGSKVLVAGQGIDQVRWQDYKGYRVDAWRGDARRAMRRAIEIRRPLG
jgi:hypothetical protein